MNDEGQEEQNSIAVYQLVNCVNKAIRYSIRDFDAAWDTRRSLENLTDEDDLSDAPSMGRDSRETCGDSTTQRILWDFPMSRKSRKPTGTVTANTRLPATQEGLWTPVRKDQHPFRCSTAQPLQ